MKKIFAIVIALFLFITIPFSVPVVANAVETEPEFVVETTELKIPIFHNASSTASILSQYIDLNELNEILLGAQQYSWDNNSPRVRCTLDSSYKIPYSSQNFSALKTYVRDESGIVGIEVYSASAKNSYFVEIVFECVSKDEYDQILKEQKQLEIETNKLLAGIKGNTSLNDVEKALLIHDRLALTCSYGYPKGFEEKVAHTTYSAIVLKKAVCQGYANAYQYLLGLVGIKSEYVSSTYLNHGWNIVYINNIPYHVDVTWDDASGYTEEGKVYHDNFLRSTQGMIETGHIPCDDGTLDYKSTPTNKTYDNYFWQNSSTGFQLLNNEIYYFDNLNKKIMKLNKTDGSDAALVRNVSYNWMFTEQGTGINSFTKLASDGTCLYYSTPTQIFKLNPVTREESVEYTLKTPDEYTGKDNVNCSLWGLSYIDCTFTYEYIIFEFGALDSKTTNQKVVKASHTESGWITDKEPNCGNTGSKHIECTVCKTVLKTETVPANGKHIIGSWETIKTATTSATGTKVKKCTVCKTVLQTASIPKIPGIPAVTVKNTATGIKLNWSATTNAKSYIVYRRTYNESTKKYSGWSVLKTGYTGTSITDKNVKFGMIYSYTVRAVNGDVKSSYKATSGVRVNVTPTVKVANASNGVKVSWNAIPNATGYTVYSATYNAKTKKWSGWTNRGTVKSGITSWTDKKTKSGTYYKYTVRACYGTFKSTYKASSSILFLAQPTVKVKAVSNGVNVNWTQSTGATGYTIYRMEYNAKTKKWSSWKNMGTTKKTAKSWTDKSAKKGVYYKYTVRAVNGSTKSTYKASGSVKR